MTRRYNPDDDGKTSVGIRINRTSADFFRDILKLVVLLLCFAAILALLGTVQYVFCIKNNPDMEFLECIRPGKK